MRQDDADLLSRLQRSGGSDTIRQGELSAAIRLGLMKLAKIDKGSPQTVTLTDQGRVARAWEFAA